jgi:hypothetical protein
LEHDAEAGQHVACGAAPHSRHSAETALEPNSALKNVSPISSRPGIAAEREYSVDVAVEIDVPIAVVLRRLCADAQGTPPEAVVGQLK